MSMSKNNFNKRLVYLVKALPQNTYIKFVGTIAMTLVAGGIFVHNIDAIHKFLLFIITCNFTVGITFGAVFLSLYKGFVKIAY